MPEEPNMLGASLWGAYSVIGIACLLAAAGFVALFRKRRWQAFLGGFFGGTFGLFASFAAGLKMGFLAWLALPGMAFVSLYVGRSVDRLLLMLLVNSLFYAGIGAFAGSMLGVRHRRGRHGHCPGCDYNLLGVEVGIGPECGAMCRPPERGTQRR
jgi:hypothetical protein